MRCEERSCYRDGAFHTARGRWRWGTSGCWSRCDRGGWCCFWCLCCCRCDGGGWCNCRGWLVVNRVSGIRCRRNRYSDLFDDLRWRWLSSDRHKSGTVSPSGRRFSFTGVSTRKEACKGGCTDGKRSGKNRYCCGEDEAFFHTSWRRLRSRLRVGSDQRKNAQISVVLHPESFDNTGEYRYLRRQEAPGVRAEFTGSETHK